MAYSERYIDRDAGRQAVAFVAPLLERAATDHAIGQSGVLYVVIMHPTRMHGEHNFDDAILTEQAFGKPRTAWDADYARYARSKAQASWQLGVASGDKVRLTTKRGSAIAVAELDDSMQPGHVALPNGLGLDDHDGAGGDGVTGVAPNELTASEDRDWLAGTPWHKHVAARIEALGPPPVGTAS